MTTPQSKFTVALPTQDNATPPGAIVVGQLTSLVFAVTAGTATADYSFPIPAAQPVGSSVVAAFASLSPAFAPVNGVAYSADVYAVDAEGNGLPSLSISWTQVAPVPAAPTFTVG